MQGKKSLVLGLVISSALLTACSTVQQVPSALANKDAADTAHLADQMTLAVNWMQQSGEYQALAHQAFNAATLAFDQAKVPRGKKKAVVVDLDETMLDNVPYDAWNIVQGKTFEPDSWTRWTKARKATAIPGALVFAQHVAQHGGTMFYISNRKAEGELQPTIDNLKALGFPGVSEKTVLLKGETSNKQPRIDSVEKQGYAVVVFAGDNLNDFGEGTYHKDNAARRAFVAAHAKDFGRKYIVLPNPVYGDWEAGLAKDYWKQSPAQRLQIRRDNLKVWDGR